MLAARRAKVLIFRQNLPENQLKFVCGIELVSRKPSSNSDWTADLTKACELIKCDMFASALYRETARDPKTYGNKKSIPSPQVSVFV